MSVNKSKIDKMISRILEEEIENKTKKILQEMEEGGEWTEIVVDEELHGGQKKLDKNKNGKIDAEDFKLLRKKKSHKQKMDEDESTPGDYEGDKETESKAEDLSAQEPTYVGKGLTDNKLGADLKNKFFGTFSDEHGWYDEKDYPFTGEFDFDYEEEEFPDFDSLMASPYAKKQMWFAPERKGSFTAGGSDGRRMFNLYQKKFGGTPFRIRKMKGLEEAETEEGNAFTDKLRKTRKGEKFSIGGKNYTDTSNLDEGKKCPKCGMTNCKCKHSKKEVDEKWDGEVKVKKTGEYAGMSLSKIDSKIKDLKSQNEKKKEKGQKVPKEDRKEMSQLYFAKRAKKDWPGKGKTAVKENKISLSLTEEELIDLIEKIVIEEQSKNLTEKKPEGLKKTEKVLQADKKENDDYAKEVVEKMKEYLKNSSEGSFEMNPKTFPQSNYTLKGMKEKTAKYHPSDAVDEYIKAFAYPGQTNLVFDEIKPDEKKIAQYLKGNRLTGNAIKDEDGNALGNVVPSDVGDLFMQNFEDNLYGAEQMEVSYKRQPQPVDVGGTEKLTGSLKSIRKGSADKAKKIMSKLESIEERKPLNEEFHKIKNLMSYNRKTQ